MKLAGRKNSARCGEEDVNGDGRLDLVCHVRTWQMLVEEGASRVVLRARTRDAVGIRGEDTIRIVR